LVFSMTGQIYPGNNWNCAGLRSQGYLRKKFIIRIER